MSIKIQNRAPLDAIAGAVQAAGTQGQYTGPKAISSCDVQVVEQLHQAGFARYEIDQEEAYLPIGVTPAPWLTLIDRKTDGKTRILDRVSSASPVFRELPDSEIQLLELSMKLTNTSSSVVKNDAFLFALKFDEIGSTTATGQLHKIELLFFEVSVPTSSDLYLQSMGAELSPLRGLVVPRGARLVVAQGSQISDIGDYTSATINNNQVTYQFSTVRTPQRTQLPRF